MSARARLVVLWGLCLLLLLAVPSPHVSDPLPPEVLAASQTDPLPPGVLCRIGDAPFSHPASRRLVGVSADGLRVYTAGEFENAPDLFAWNAATGRLLFCVPMTRPDERCENVALAAEGVKVLVGDDAGYRVRVFDGRTGAVARTGRVWQTDVPIPRLGLEGKNLLHVEMLLLSRSLPTAVHSPDGSRVIVAADSGYRVYDTETGRSVPVKWTVPADILQQHDRIFKRENLLFPLPKPKLPDMLIAAEIPESPLPTHPFHFEFSPDGRFVALVGPGSGSVSLYSCITGAMLRHITFDERYGPALGFAADGETYLAWEVEMPRIALVAYDLPAMTRRVLRTGPPHLGLFRFAPDGKRFAFLDSRPWMTHQYGDWEIRRHESEEPLAVVPSDKYPWRAAFSPDGRTFYTESASGRVVPWDARRGVPKLPPGTTPGDVEAFQFTRDGLLATWAGGHAVVWDPRTGREQFRARPANAARRQFRAGLTPDGAGVAFADVLGRATFWDYRGGSETVLPYGATDLSMDGGIWWARQGFFDSRSWTPLKLPALPPECQHSRMDFFVGSADRRHVAVAGHVHSLWPSQRATGTVVARHDLAAGTSRGRELSGFVVRALDVSPTGRFVALSGEEDGRQRLKVWDTATGRTTAADLGPPCLSVVGFAPDGRSLAVAADGVIRVYEVATWRVRKVLPNPRPQSPDEIPRARGNWTEFARFAFSLDSWLVAVGQGDGGVVVLDVRGEGEPLPPERAWDVLRSDDAAAALTAIRSLAKPDAVAFLTNRCPPASDPDPAALGRLVAALDDEEYAARERASDDLAALGQVAQRALSDAHRSADSPEARNRLSRVLGRLARGNPTADEVRAVRVVEAVEWMGTPESVKLLEAWAGGFDGARLTVEAKAALARVTKR